MYKKSNRSNFVWVLLHQVTSPGEQCMK